MDDSLILFFHGVRLKKLGTNQNLTKKVTQVGTCILFENIYVYEAIFQQTILTQVPYSWNTKTAVFWPEPSDAWHFIPYGTSSYVVLSLNKSYRTSWDMNYVQCEWRFRDVKFSLCVKFYWIPLTKPLIRTKGGV